MNEWIHPLDPRSPRRFHSSSEMPVRLRNRRFVGGRGGWAGLLLLLLLATGACGEREEEAFRPEPVVSSGDRPVRGTAWVIFGTDTIRAEVARTDEERSRGMMFREEVPENTGMLFVFEGMEPRAFWMRNTPVALDIAFLDSGFRIVDIQTMAPLDETLTESAAPAMYALEVRAGWFADQGIDVGTTPRIVF